MTRKIHRWILRKTGYDYALAEAIETAIGGVCAVIMIIAPTLIIGA